MSADLIYTDTFICGGGPVGLLLAYSLARLKIPTYIIERHNKERQARYGRACTLYPRTLEILDQVDLLDEMNQTGFISRGTVTYKDGKRLTDCGWISAFEMIHGTYMDYVLNIRQKYSEEIFASRYQDLGNTVHTEWTLKECVIDEAAADGYRVTSKIQHEPTGQTKTVKSRFVVGADGGHSTVRELTQIPFEGNDTQMKWIRIDGYFKTDMPDSRFGSGCIESAEHGVVLWACLDHGANRIGFALTPALYAKYGDAITEEQVKAEAVKAMAPFTLEIEKVEWWTLYTVKQKLARRFLSANSILLAGDASHVHSSAAAQGMNTGVHDVSNLAWKLAGTLKGWFTPSVLQTYDSERRATAHTLISLDRQLSATISNHLPAEYAGAPIDPKALTSKLFAESVRFSIGLDVHYSANVLNRPPTTGMVTHGWRAPDMILRRPGARLPIRLFTITKAVGAFWILVFAGQPLLTAERLVAFRKYLDGNSSFTTFAPEGMVRFATIMVGTAPQSEVALGGVKRFGDVFFDVDSSAHEKYYVAVEAGAVVVLRPDGILGYAAGLMEGEAVGEYFRGFVRR